MNINDKYVVKIIDEDNIGNGIAKIDDMIVFVSGALKGDILNIKIDTLKKRYATAKINKVIYPSQNRIIPKCKYYNECGGCSFLHTTYKNERNAKQKYLEKIFGESDEELVEMSKLDMEGLKNKAASLSIEDAASRSGK